MEDIDGNEFDDISLVGSNASAYEKREVRVGVPLAYVAEKLSSCLSGLHSLIHSTGKQPVDPPQSESALSGKQVSFPAGAQYAFHNGCKAYLALYNLLALINEPGLVERLLTAEKDEFDHWTEFVHEQGSLHHSSS